MKYVTDIVKVPCYDHLGPKTMDMPIKGVEDPAVARRIREATEAAMVALLEAYQAEGFEFHNAEGGCNNEGGIGLRLVIVNPTRYAGMPRETRRIESENDVKQIFYKFMKDKGYSGNISGWEDCMAAVFCISIEPIR